MVVPTIIIANEGDSWTFKMRSSFKNTDDEFKIGVEFDDGLYFKLTIVLKLLVF